MNFARVFLTVAVHKPEPGNGQLAPLPGVVESAARVAQWAKAHGYVSLEISDADGTPVTVQSVQNLFQGAIDDLLANQGIPINRIVVYFAGHGYADSNGRNYWLLTNWYSEPTEAINVQNLQRMLGHYNPVQVSLIGDACSEINQQSLTIIGHPILKRPNEPWAPIEVDQFFAADAGQKAYAIRATDGNAAFCLFTETLLDALEGEKESAFDIEQPGALRVTSQSLRNYLVEAIPLEASRYNVEMVANPWPGFSTDRVYAEFPVGSLLGEEHPGKLLGLGNTPGEYGKDFNRLDPSVARDGPFDEPTITGGREISESGGIEGGVMPSDGRHPADLSKFDPLEWPRIPTEERSSFSRITSRILFRSERRPDENAARRLIELRQAEQDGRRKSSIADWSAVDDPVDFESRSGLLIAGVNVGEVVSLQDGLIDSFDGNRRTQVWLPVEPGLVPAPRFLDLAATHEDGKISCVSTLRGFVSMLTFDSGGLPSLVYRESGVLPSEDRQTELLDTIARMSNGVLSLDEASSFAAQIRVRKHVDPVLGCVAAYFYDSFGDVESIARTASYYPHYGQPVPLDLAILCGGPITMDAGGSLRVDIPATRERAPYNVAEKQRPFTTEATASHAQAVVAGMVPWMRGGWSSAALTPVNDRLSERWRDRVVALAPAVLDLPFSTLKAGSLPALRELAQTT